MSPVLERRHLNRGCYQNHLQIDALGLKKSLVASHRDRQVVQALRRIGKADSVGGEASLRVEKKR